MLRIIGAVLLVFPFAFLLSTTEVSCAEQLGGPAPELVFKVPEQQAHADYLGITINNGESFKMTDINADILLIELFSMYCPFCQEEAPLINELYELMRSLPDDGPKVKLIGIGAGNSEIEVNHFRTTFDVEFPLFPDKDLSKYKALSGEGTPGFIGLRKDAEQGFVIVFRQSGGFYSKEDFLEQLLARGSKE